MPSSSSIAQPTLLTDEDLGLSGTHYQTLLPTAVPAKAICHLTPLEDQFKPKRMQTKVYAGKVKTVQSERSVLSEDDIYKAKFQRDFPKYVDRKKEKYSWKKYYEKRMEKKQKKESVKMGGLKIRIAIPEEMRKTLSPNALPTKSTIPSEPVTKTIGSTSSFNNTPITFTPSIPVESQKAVLIDALPMKPSAQKVIRSPSTSSTNSTPELVKKSAVEMAKAIGSAKPKGTKVPKVVPVGLSFDSKFKGTKNTTKLMSKCLRMMRS